MVFEELLVIGVSVIFLPGLLKKIHVNVRSGEVITGALLAFLLPQMMSAEWISSVADIGLIVLMFEIGLDIDIDVFKEDIVQSLKSGWVSFFSPFLVLGLMVFYLSDSLMTTGILAIGLSSSALAVVFPVLRDRDISSSLVENATMISEMTAVTLLVAFVRGKGANSLPLWLQVSGVLGFILLTVFLVPKIVEKLQVLHSKKIIEFETKLVLFIVFAMALISESLGIHAATGAFLAGLFFSESTHRGSELEERISPVIDLFTPIFFLYLGTLIKIGSIDSEILGLTALLFASTYIARIAGFKLVQLFGESSFDLEKINLLAPCITITATAAGIGKELGVISDPWFTSFILAGLALTIIGPLVARVNR